MLRDVVRAIFQRPTTRLYPFARREPPERLRGRLYWDPEKCTGCCLCTRECPADAIELITVDRTSKQFVLRYHEDRCAFCEQCVRNCRFGCLEMSSEDWELAALKKEAFTVHYGDEADVKAILDPRVRADAEPAER